MRKNALPVQRKGPAERARRHRASMRREAPRASIRVMRPDRQTQTGKITFFRSEGRLGHPRLRDESRSGAGRKDRRPPQAERPVDRTERRYEACSQAAYHAGRPGDDSSDRGRRKPDAKAAQGPRALERRSEPGLAERKRPERESQWWTRVGTGSDAGPHLRLGVRNMVDAALEMLSTVTSNRFATSRRKSLLPRNEQQSRRSGAGCCCK